ncbi:MAG: hypothetical protein U5Q44_08825 [Dehalococcoidia bacterium]|nr:hypothetical protein [Dehalococcoidia bacterium]
MLWGAPGNGKTTILELCSEAIQGYTILPVAVWVSGHIIRLYDDLVHVQVGSDSGAETMSTSTAAGCAFAARSCSSVASSGPKTSTWPTTPPLATTRRRPM